MNMVKTICALFYIKEDFKLYHALVTTVQVHHCTSFVKLDLWMTLKAEALVIFHFHTTVKLLAVVQTTRTKI